MRDGYYLEPLTVEAKHQAPWQFAVFEHDAGEIVADVLDGFSAWNGLLSKKRLENFRSVLGRESVSKLNMVRVFNLYAATILLVGRGRGQVWKTFRSWEKIARFRAVFSLLRLLRNGSSAKRW